MWTLGDMASAMKLVMRVVAWSGNGAKDSRGIYIEREGEVPMICYKLYFHCCIRNTCI